MPLLEPWIALTTVTAVAVILGLDNLLGLLVVAESLHPEIRDRARRRALWIALFLRLALLFGILYVLTAFDETLQLGKREFSIRQLLLGGGGIYLVLQALLEIRQILRPPRRAAATRTLCAGLARGVLRILAVDMLLSVDSILLVVAIAPGAAIMVFALSVEGLLLIAFTPAAAAFVERNPSVKTLAVASLLLVGVMLIFEGLGHEIERSYFYVAVVFALFVEIINLVEKRRT